MVDAAFLIVTFIILAIGIGLLIFYIFTFLSFPDTPPPQPNPDTVECDPTEVLQAWIENTPNRAACPAFTNNYVIATDDIRMFEKNFQVDPETDCCWFSDSLQKRAYFPLPWICISRTDGRSFSLTELNEKPYAFDNDITTYLVPPCEENLEECFGLIRFDTDGSDGLYKLFLIGGKKDELSSPGSGPDLFSGNCSNLKNASFEDVVFKIGPDCGTLIDVSISGKIVVRRSRVDNRIVYEFDCEPSDIPDYIPEIVNLFSSRSERFFPIAGENPQLSQNAAQS